MGRTYRWPDDSPPRAPLAVLREVRDLGFLELDLVEPPLRFEVPRPSNGPVRAGLDGDRAHADPDPLDLLARFGQDESPMAHSRRALAKLSAWFLLAEDPQRRLDARPVSTLAHQASVVRHILTEPSLLSVLLADEVGLGKTVEAGLLIKELLQTTPSTRVLYLAPAGLVSNVYGELTRLGLPFRRWTTGQERDAQISDQLVVASIHRAVHPAHYDRVVSAARWDLLVVDECHHLSDWQKGSGKPTQKYKLVDTLRQQLAPTGRLLLMSGTPHQGHADRFENLLKLLRRGNEERTALAGRVIYRTKDHVRDWDGRPLFPRRKVFPPLIVNLGDEYRQWLERIHRVFDVRRGDEDEVGQARRRALNWRCGQALQWATSSIQAGIGFLVRQALRAGWSIEHAPLRDAIASLRPYRSGTPDEPEVDLFARLKAEIGLPEELEDLEAPDSNADVSLDDRWRPPPGALEQVLRDGLRLLESQADAKWQHVRAEIVDRTAGEKVVLFAQPIETVTALAAYLERIDGRRPAMIIGGQNSDERMRQVEAFYDPDGPRFLVSSKAGGEGLNLQVARVLVHVDVPWNPMDMEQRVGRVHRFMSKRTIEVHTVVVKDSREVDIYDAARLKLRGVAQTMAPDDFEDLFSRVMALVPPEELADVLVRDALGPLEDRDIEELGRIVVAGYRRWEQFHKDFAETHQQIRSVAAGAARWDDVERFARDQAGAVVADGFTALRFRFDEGEVVEASEAATVLSIGGDVFACGDYGAMPVLGAQGRRARQLGLNAPAVVASLQRAGLSEAPSGAFHVRLARELPGLEGHSATVGTLWYARSILSQESGAFREVGLELLAFLVDADGNVSRVSSTDIGELFRALQGATVRRDVACPDGLLDGLRRADERLAPELRRTTDRARRHAVFPLAVGVLDPA